MFYINFHFLLYLLSKIIYIIFGFLIIYIIIKYCFRCTISIEIKKNIQNYEPLYIVGYIESSSDSE